MKHYYTCILTNLFVIKHVKNTFDSFCPALMVYTFIVSNLYIVTLKF